MVKKSNNILSGQISRSGRSDAIIRLLLAVAILLLLNVVAGLYYFRLDLTSEKRYSISKPTKEMLRNLKDEVTVKVYLGGNLNAGFTRLKESTRNLLKEFRAYGSGNIEYDFIDPMAIENLDERKALMTDLIQKGLVPTNLKTKSKTGSNEQLIFPGAIVTYLGRQMPVQLLENQMGYSPQEILNNSEIELEYKFANSIQKLVAIRPPRIAFLHGHGELAEIETADLRATLESLQYEIKDIDISKAFLSDNIDVVIIAKPVAAFDEKDKYKIDQYIMHGGKTLWLVDGTDAQMDSLMNASGTQFVIGNDLNLEDMLFKYGVRINSDLVVDINLYNSIPLGPPGGQLEMFPWYYFPLLVSDNNHAIVKNLDPVASFFPSSIDTIKNPGIKKTILLHSSDNAKAQLAPTRIQLKSALEKPNPEYFNQPKIPVAVLLEGPFESVYNNRLAPEFLAVMDTIKNLKFVGQSKSNKMIVISNGDIIRNDLRTDSTWYPLGYYKFDRRQFANKDFILNCIEYLMDNSGILETRNKEIKLRLLNTVEVEDQKLKWQIINIVLPIVIVIFFGVLFNYYRRKKYAR